MLRCHLCRCHFSHPSSPPLGNAKGKASVGANAGKGHAGKEGPAAVGQQAGDHAHFQRDGQHVEDERVEHKVDAAAAGELSSAGRGGSVRHGWGTGVGPASAVGSRPRHNTHRVPRSMARETAPVCRDRW